jgi:cyclopropane fatty-acyl-phospholipid synthase-like methyltransferase
MTEREKREGEAQYGELVEAMRRRGPERMGFMTSWAWVDDPKRLAFMLSRYKFVAKMLAGADKVLEIGCGDGFGTRVVAQAVGSVVAIDFDPDFIESAKATASDKYPIEFRSHNMLKGPVPKDFDGCYCLDVLEHIAPADEDAFLANVVASLSPSGSLIVGTPSLESQPYASKFSRLGHVNCKTQSALREFLLRYFHNVFSFSMNDEVVHTGYEKMAQYNLALCCYPRKR